MLPLRFQNGNAGLMDEIVSELVRQAPGVPQFCFHYASKIQAQNRLFRNANMR